MATFNELLQNAVNSDYSTLVKNAQTALVALMPLFKKLDEEHEGVFLSTSVILSAIAADGVLTGLEKKFLGDVLGLSDDTISKFISMYDSRMVELTDKLADSNDTVKAAILALIVPFCAVDEKISREETAFIRKILV